MLIDLSQRFETGMFQASIFPDVLVERCIKYEEARTNVTRIGWAVHIGTHIDAPVHMFPGRPDVADLRLDEVSGDAVCWSFDVGPRSPIGAADLDRATPTLKPGDIVFLHTGWGEYFRNDHARYREHPYLTVDAAEWLVNAGAKLVIVDTPTPDIPDSMRPEGFNWPVHQVLLGNGVLIAEHAAHLEKVAGKRFRAFAFPIAIATSDGAPVRIVAEL